MAATKRGKKKGNAPATPPVDDVVLRDRVLVDSCLAGQASAWSVLYQHCHEPLLAAIRTFLRDSGDDVHLVEEIAARVWYLVVRNDAELLSRFDVTRNCRLTTFLSVLAKSEARQYFRAERRRRLREETASRKEAVAENETGLASGLTHGEFLASLSPSERVYYDNVLTSNQSDGDETYTSENGWQLRHRVRKKLSQFFDHGR